MFIHRLSLGLIFIALLLSGCGRSIYVKDIVKEDNIPEYEIYKTIDNHNLKLYVFYPPEYRESDRRTAVVCIHGGGFSSGNPNLFFPHCRYFAKRGAVTFSVNYRLTKPHESTVYDCLADCKSAIRYIRTHAEKLGIDPNRVAVLGDSAGGHLAACLGTNMGIDNPGDDLSVSPVANVVIMCNPVADMTVPPATKMEIPGIAKETTDNALRYGPTTEERARRISPIHNVVPNQSPSLLMHGEEDSNVPIEQANRYYEAMKNAGNDITYYPLEGVHHAFVLPGYGTEETVVTALQKADEFLVSQGFLKGRPQIRLLDDK
ncbi:MAG: alpha/beta hydrolase [Candidatus Latescibacteria bacterium]|nr:alpha/beta hydrolase [Candidatus Latescibacterota bacterium]